MNLYCTHIINLSINTGTFPDQMKIARVIPLLKLGGRFNFTSYRPVSVLPCFSKLLERIIYNRLIRFLDKYDILFDNQYGFKKNHSTNLALIHLYDKLSSAIDQREYTMGVKVLLTPILTHYLRN